MMRIEKNMQIRKKTDINYMYSKYSETHHLAPIFEFLPPRNGPVIKRFMNLL